MEFVAGRKVDALDPATHEAVLSDGSRLPYDLFLGIPEHRAPAVVLASVVGDLTEDEVGDDRIAARRPTECWPDETPLEDDEPDYDSDHDYDIDDDDEKMTTTVPTQHLFALLRLALRPNTCAKCVVV